MVVVLAVKFPFPEVAAGGQGLLTHGALQTLFVPRGVVDPHQEAVGDGPLAPLTHRGVRAVRPCKAAAWVSHVHRGEYLDSCLIPNEVSDRTLVKINKANKRMWSVEITTGSQPV